MHLCICVATRNPRNPETPETMNTPTRTPGTFTLLHIYTSTLFSHIPYLHPKKHDPPGTPSTDPLQRLLPMHRAGCRFQQGLRVPRHSHLEQVARNVRPELCGASGVWFPEKPVHRNMYPHGILSIQKISFLSRGRIDPAGRGINRLWRCCTPVLERLGGYYLQHLLETGRPASRHRTGRGSAKGTHPGQNSRAAGEGPASFGTRNQRRAGAPADPRGGDGLELQSPHRSREAFFFEDRDL